MNIPPPPPQNAQFGSSRAAANAANRSPGKPDQLQKSVCWSRTVPLRFEADVAVIGGGIAGVCAACAAAATGARVILIERFAVVGGMLTTGGVANFCGDLEGQGEVFDRILGDLRAFGALGEDGHGTVFHYELLAVVLQELLLRRGVTLLLHTRCVDAVVEDGMIQSCIVSGKSGVEAVAARQFIDCSGEADLARAAGCRIMKGRDSDHLQLPMSVMFFVRHVPPEHRRAHLPEGWLEPVQREPDLPMTSVWPDGPGSNAIKVKIPMFDACNTESLTAAEIRARRRMLEVLDYYQRQEKRNWRLDHCAPMIGVREGCRVLGHYILTVEDLRAGRSFDDAIARGTFYLDGHKPDDDKRTYILPRDALQVPPYQIPLRALVAKDIANLMMAGRCFSADQLALSSARVSTTGAMMGQAAGVAAALCAQKNSPPANADAKEVRTILEQGGSRIAL